MRFPGKILSVLFLTLFTLTLSLFLIKQSSNAQETNGRFINNFISGKCIDVAGASSRSNGAPLQLWDCELSGVSPEDGSMTDQRWILTSDGFIRNALSGKCIDVAGASSQSNGAPLQLWDCELSGVSPNNGLTTDQRWTVTDNGFVQNTLSGKCIDVAGAPGQSNGARLQLWDCELSGHDRDNGSATDQQWSFVN
jgi:Ricin-type beta-trefoil lectin domain